MSITVALSGIITITDNLTGSVSYQKQVIGSYVGTVSTEGQNVLVTGATSLALPASPTNFVYIKNLATATSVLTVTWTPNGGSTNTVVALQPSSFIILDENNASSGITALSVTPSVASTPIEYILVG
jgi:hypothetical protein